MLRRSYLKRVKLPDGRELFLRFEWTPRRGWAGITAFEKMPVYFEKQRSGALLYRRT